MLKAAFALHVLLASGVTAASADETSRDPSTWRWTTTEVLRTQRAPESTAGLARNEFTQRYERYSFNGQIEAPR